MYSKFLGKFVTFVCFLFVISFSAYSQPTVPGEGGDPGGDGPGGGVPVDGGLAILLATGVGYGAKKAYDYKKGRKEKENK